MKLKIFTLILISCLSVSWLTAQIVVLENLKCQGDSIGSLLVVPDFGASPYSFLWNTGDTSNSVSNLPAGTYSVTVTDTFLISQLYSYTFTDPLPVTITNDLLGNIECNGALTGAIGISVSGGSSPYTYTWTRDGMFFAATQDISNIPAGNYAITVEDFFDCETTDSYVIVEPPTAIQLQISAGDVSCFGGSDGNLSVVASGGTGTLSYLWSTGDVTSQVLNVGAGNYSVTVTDSLLCSSTASVLVSQPVYPIQITTIQTNILCFGDAAGYAEITDVSGANGPLSYQWSNGSSLPYITDVIAGNYILTVTDFLGCTGNANILIQQPPQIQLSSSTIIPSDCDGHNNGAISISVIGGVSPYTYEWREIHFDSTYTTQNIANVRGGDYALTITDANGCFFFDTLTIPNIVYVPVSMSVNSYVCNGLQGGVGITANEADSAYYFTYSWSSTYNTGSFITNDTVFSSSTAFLAGSYTITLTNNQTGCAHYYDLTINQSVTPMTVAEVIHHNNCYEDLTGSVILYPTGGDPLPAYQVTWTGPNGFTSSAFHIQNLASGDYFYTVTDDMACIVQGTARVEPVYPVQGYVTTEDILCYGYNNGSANAVFTGGTGTLNYLWSNGATTAFIQSLTAGNYTVSVTDSLGCMKTETIVISQPPELFINTDFIQDVSCFGYSDGFIQTGTGGGTNPLTYTWLYNGNNFQQITEDIVNLEAGNYELILTDSSGCSTSEFFIVNQPEETIFTDSVHVISCNNGADGYWEIVPTGLYHPYIAIFSTGDTISTDTVPALSVSGLNAGLYQSTITDANGCVWNFSLLLEQPLPITVGLFDIQHVICKGDSTGIINLDAVHGGTAPYTYLWSNGATVNPLAAIPAGIYNVTITDHKNCDIQETYEVHEPYEYIKYFPTVINTSCLQSEDGSVVLYDENIYWSPFQNTFYLYDTLGTLIGSVPPGQPISNLAAGNYVTFLINEHGCSATDSITVGLGEENCILIPNLVTPNADGYNDVFAVKGGCFYDTFFVQIFTDWGAKVFESTECNFIWNPKDNNAAANTVYYYYIKVTEEDNVYEFKSSIDIKY